MARKARAEFPGAVYHVLDRGDRRKTIFREDRDRDAFLATLGEVCRRTGWWVHAYVLISNHYHLLIETPRANLVAGMRWFQTTVTARFNRRHRLCGHLFQGRFKSIVIDPLFSPNLVKAAPFAERSAPFSKRSSLFDERNAPFNPRIGGAWRRRPPAGGRTVPCG